MGNAQLRSINWMNHYYWTVFMNRPNQNKARVAGTREFRIDLVGAGALATYGVANAL